MNFVKNFVLPAAILTIICLVISGALVLTYSATAPIIESAKAAESNAARAVVLTGGEKFEQVQVKVADVTEAYKAGNGKGYVFTAKAKGYGGDMFVMVGVKTDGTIDQVKLMSNNETPGQGTQTGEAKYTDLYKGKSGADVDSVEAIAGATVSSFAFKHAVQSSLDAYGELEGVVVEKAPTKSPEEILFPGVDPATFEPLTLEGAEKAMKVGDKGILILTKADGYTEAPTKMQVYTAIGPDGKIIGVAMGENTETQGIGSKTGDAAYTSQYAGKDSVDGIAAVSGATESSEGFQAAVKQALEIYAASALKGA